MLIDKKIKKEGSLHRGFIVRVLVPPFVVLLVLAVIGLWQLDRLLRQQALDGLRRAAVATAAKIDREFALRETVLKRSGEEIFTIKREYLENRRKLDENRESCREHVRRHNNFAGAPGGVCEPFSGAAGRTLYAAIENAYVEQGLALIAEQDVQINDRLSAYKQFFPETVGLIVADENKQIISSALSGAFPGTAEIFQPDAVLALENAIKGKQMSVEDAQLTVFAYPIKGGSVLAAYDRNHENFLRQIWESAPVDRSRALAVIVDAEGNPVYPDLRNGNDLKEHNGRLRNEPYAEIMLGDVRHAAVGVAAGDSDWLAAAASPTAVVLAPVRDSRLISIAVIGLLIAGYAWLGTFFIRRTLQNISRLVSGAIIFGSGRLDYPIVLSHAGSEFTLLADTMNNMAGRIAKAEQAIDEKNKEFISVATHELRTPMTAIIGHLSMVKELYGGKLDPKAGYMIDQAYYGTARLRDLVNDMLNVARLESGRSESALAPVHIKDVALSVVETMEVVAKIADVRLRYRSKNAASVMADESRLRIIINNFVSNAIKYNRPGGNVTIAHERQDNMLITSIADNGLGIPEDQKAHMFEKFFRVQHEDRKSVTGTGLGMYIVKEYIENMHGKLWFESTHGQGTTFFFSLPIVENTGKDKKPQTKKKQLPQPVAAKSADSRSTPAA